MLQYDINGHHKQHLQVDIIFNYVFHFGLPETCIYASPEITPFWHRPRALIICVKTCSWKPKMNHVVKYGVYMDILLMVATYVIKY